MLNKDYELNIISNDDKIQGKRLKKYIINDKETIGVFENEPFTIEFKNNTYNRIQVRLSVDGTDILTGDVANLDATSKMWVVEPYGSLSLKAWPENTQGGAEFLFGNTKDSVAANTHGNLSSRGTISAAVFVEGYIQPSIWGSSNIINNWPNNFGIGGGINYNGNNITYRTKGTTAIYSNNIASNSTSFDNSVGSLGGAVMDCMEISASVQPAVGAGDYVQQEITKTSGLRQAKLDQILCISYKWWNELRSELRSTTPKSTMAAVGFPGEEKMIDLKNTPRKTKNKSKNHTKKPQHVEFYRFV